jgi:hypothetical protein
MLRTHHGIVQTRTTVAGQPVATGMVGVRPIDWEARPTLQPVAWFTRHR